MAVVTIPVAATIVTTIATTIVTTIVTTVVTTVAMIVATVVCMWGTVAVTMVCQFSRTIDAAMKR
jgi:hypothetical protein